MPRRIVHMTTVHGRTDIRIFRKECITLRDAGYDVHLVVADGKGKATANGVVIHDIGQLAGRVKRMLLLPPRAFSYVRALRPDIVHFHDPELLPIGLALRLLGHKVIYDAHEDLPRAILSKYWIRPSLRQLVARLSEVIENFCARRLAAVVGATPHISDRFRTIQPNTVNVTNFPVIDDSQPMLPRAVQGRCVIYVGGISRKRAAIEMVQAAAMAKARLILAGPIEDPQLETDLAAMPEWANVEYMGTVEQDRIWGMMARAQAGLLLFFPEPNHINSVPNKMFEYMAGGIPIVCSNFDDWRGIIQKHDIGLMCDPTDTKAIANAICQLIDDPDHAETIGRRARQVVLENYRWENEGAKLLALYDALLADPR